MESLQPIQAHSTIMTRVQRVRARMIVETMSGIPAADKDIFLSLCCQYEQNFAPTEFAASTTTTWRHWDDDNWADWFKLGTIE